MSHRSDPVQLGPPGEPNALDGFPPALIQTVTWWREHAYRETSPDNGCWWFGSREEPTDPPTPPGGRFSVWRPNGTCYLATSRGVAARERVGRFLAARMPIPEAHVHGRCVSTLTWSPTGPVADLLHTDTARFGVTTELGSGNNYAVSSDWAQALLDAGFTAIRYVPRFSPGFEYALALFGDAGSSPDRGIDYSVPLAETLGDLGFEVLPAPSTHSMSADDSIEPEEA